MKSSIFSSDSKHKYGDMTHSSFFPVDEDKPKNDDFEDETVACRVFVDKTNTRKQPPCKSIESRKSPKNNFRF